MRTRPPLTTVLRSVGEFNTSLIARARKIDYNKIATTKKIKKTGVESSTRLPTGRVNIFIHKNSIHSRKYIYSSRKLFSFNNVEFRTYQTYLVNKFPQSLLNKVEVQLCSFRLKDEEIADVEGSEL